MNLERVQLPGVALWLPASDEPRNLLGQTLTEYQAMKTAKTDQVSALRNNVWKDA